MFKTFGEITHAALQSSWRARKKAERHETEGDSDGVAICTVSRLCPPGAVVTTMTREMITRDTTSAATCREVSEEPLTTERGCLVQERSRGFGYMDEAALADGGGERVGIVGSAAGDWGGNSGAARLTRERALVK